jgi:hypothetical protein
VLEIVVLGNGQREGIVVGFDERGEQKWVVVDCCCSRRADSRTNASLAFLESRGARTVELLCVTHPHEDHICGVAQLMSSDELSVPRVVRFPSVEAHRLTDILTRRARVEQRALRAIERSAGRRLQWVEDTVSEHIDELRAFDALLEEGMRAGLIEVPVESPIQVYPPPNPAMEGERSAVEIWAIGPPRRAVRAYERLLRGEGGSGSVAVSVISEALNLLSVCLLVKYGCTSILLAADTVDAAWEGIIDQFALPRLSMVKVAHHGSDYSLGKGVRLWEDHICVDGTPVTGVIAPFRALPTAEALAYLCNYCEPLLLTVVPEHLRSLGGYRLGIGESISPGTSWAVLEDVGVEVYPKATVRESLAGGRLTAVEKKDVGVCHLGWDDQGNCVSNAYHGPVGRVTRVEGGSVRAERA